MNWFNVVLLALLVAGHTAVAAAVINRVHAWPLGPKTLRRLRHLHDALVLLFPVVLIWFVGWRGPSLLINGNWSGVSMGWIVYLAMCACGIVGLCVSAIRWTSRRVAAVQVSNHSAVVDVAQQLGYRPLGNGLSRWMAHVPGNEVFQVEVSDKVYRLPRLPAAWAGLSILHLSDFHFIGTIDRPYFEYVAGLAQELNPDLIVFTGDLMDDEQFLNWLPSTLGRLTAPLGSYFILGNHDWYIGAPQIRRHLTHCGWRDVAGTTACVEWRGRSLVIAGTERPWMGDHPDFTVTDDSAFRVLLSHTPDNLSWAKQHNVDLMLAGHNHGGQVRLPVIGPVFAPSAYGVRYGSGAFWEPPTLLYVSRGLSGRHPLRFRCLPELTKLILQPE